jgi:hypothetical protein
MNPLTTKYLDDKQTKGLIRGYQVNNDVKKEDGKANKYKNKKAVVDGKTFDSKKEAAKFLELRMMQAAGIIHNLQTQVPYLLIEKNGKERKCVYKADFVYIMTETGILIIEDVKSKATRRLSTYIMKRKLMKEKYGIEIKET